MLEPYKVTDASEILTKEVIRSLQMLFKHAGLSMREAYVRLDGKTWSPFPLTSAKQDWPDAPFCAHVRTTEPYQELCARDRTTCCDPVMGKANKQRQWHCPYGLRVQGLGFQVGNAEIVLRSAGWAERGNEGYPIRKTTTVLQDLGRNEDRSRILDLLKIQFARADGEAHKEAEAVEALLSLVSAQAEGRYKHNVENTKKAFIDEVSKLVVPLMDGTTEAERSSKIGQALEGVTNFLGLRGCVYYFVNSESQEAAVRITNTSLKSPAKATEPRILHSLIFTGSRKPGTTEILEPAQLQEISSFLGSPCYGCLVSYPGNNAALLVALPLDHSSLSIDDRMLSDITRTLSYPVCVAFLLTGIKREAELRWIQSRNNAHTVRSTFQGVMGEVDNVRIALLAEGEAAESGKLPQKVDDALTAVEEQVEFINSLLLSYDFVADLHAPAGTRPMRLANKPPQKIVDLLTTVRNSLQTRAKQRFIDIVLSSSLSTLPPIRIDEKAVTLVFVSVLQNALKYSHSGSIEKWRTIDVKGRYDYNNIYVEIEDFGLGIHPEERERIFLPYVQGSVEDATRPISGQGLGLASARTIAQLHQGNVVLKRCAPYDAFRRQIPESRILSLRPNSKEAADLLQHCLVVFEIWLPRKD